MSAEFETELEKWWKTEPFGFDHPDTKLGILKLMEFARSHTLKTGVVLKLVEAAKKLQKETGFCSCEYNPPERYRDPDCEGCNLLELIKNYKSELEGIE